MSSDERIRILVLCTGNICRSPVAEAMIVKKFRFIEGLSVQSGGLNAPVGIPPHPLSAKTSSQLGYLIEPDKVSRSATMADLRSADLILVMELIHRDMVAALLTEAIPKTFLLGHWSVGEIPDPIGRSEGVFVSVAEQLNRACDEWKEKLAIVGVDAIKAFRR